MANKDFDQDHLNTLQRDMSRFQSVGVAATSVGQGIFGPLLGLLFIVVTGL